ncbi:hypothetical protein C8J36_11528 [Rhizobium sp. PP-F2F-G48]|uniref:DUF6894 family protein n=1 Tax=Rhizobium sp. PP-F2F-G48 TaxID=2135651 RepID=UPI001053A724|nr:hypothetical protein [Rhizobium sp. PP-F2F-G48]TCM47415.1 hypothetical protein C8J36_11528 [Rhizobium sp. PP-F2F-G48]
MTRYFFSIERRTGLCADDEGRKCVSDTEARIATAFLCKIAGESLKAGHRLEIDAIRITKGDGILVCSKQSWLADLIVLLSEKIYILSQLFRHGSRLCCR